MQCFSCHAVLPPDARFCPMCGISQEAVTSPTQRLDTAHPSGLVDSFCPKCGSVEIYVDERGLVTDDRNEALALNDVELRRTERISTYVCASCGYIELYAANMAHLTDMIKKWRRVKRW